MADSSFQRARLLIVCGVSASGKSSVGRALADRLGGEFVDGDDYHGQENIKKEAAGYPLDDDDRWLWLDRIGTDLATREGLMVCACSALRRVYRERLQSSSGEALLFVFLEGSRACIESRMASRSDHFMPISLLESQFQTLEAPGEDENVIAVDVDHSNVEEVVTIICAKYQSDSGKTDK